MKQCSQDLLKGWRQDIRQTGFTEDIVVFSPRKRIEVSVTNEEGGQELSLGHGKLRC